MPITRDGHTPFKAKIANFPEEVYSFKKHTHLRNLMEALLEHPGLGQLKKLQLLVRASEVLGGTSFSDLDYFFGEFLRFARLDYEQYDYDPFRDQLTTAKWNEIEIKDALYRERISMFLQALLRGGTNEGIAMAAEAACAFKCQVIELWRLETGSPSYGRSIGRMAGSAAKEFVVVPMTDDGTLTLSEEKAIYHVCNRLKPINTFCTVDVNGLAVQTIITIRHAVSPTEYYEIKKYITPTKHPAPPPTKKTWIQDDTETEAPKFAYLRSSDASWSLNASVSTINAFTLSPTFPERLGTLVSDIIDSDTSITVAETSAPSSQIFTIQIDDEIIDVTDRISTGNKQFTYTVVRGQDDTTAASHTATTLVMTNYSVLHSDQHDSTQQFGPWRAIDVSDSPDNFPDGKYSGDPNKYDDSGNYIFAWDSQNDYTAWFLKQISLLDGEVSGNQYRLPQSLEVQPGAKTKPDFSLAPPEIIVTSKYYPGDLSG